MLWVLTEGLVLSGFSANICAHDSEWCGPRTFPRESLDAGLDSDHSVYKQVYAAGTCAETGTPRPDRARVLASWIECSCCRSAKPVVGVHAFRTLESEARPRRCSRTGESGGSRPADTAPRPGSSPIGSRGRGRRSDQPAAGLGEPPPIEPGPRPEGGDADRCAPWLREERVSHQSRRNT